MKTGYVFIFWFSLLSNFTLSQWSKSAGITEYPIERFYKYGGYLFASANNGGVLRSSDNGMSWSNQGLLDKEVKSFARIGSKLFATSHGSGLFFSSDSGSTWSQVIERVGGSTCVLDLIEKDSILYASTNGGGVSKSTDFGITWISLNNGINSVYNHNLIFIGDTLYAGSSTNGACMSTNFGQEWKDITSTITNKNITSIGFSSPYLFIGTGGSGVYRSSNNGLSWENVLYGGGDISMIQCYTDNIFVSTSNGVYYSRTKGNEWANISEGIDNKYILSLYASDKYLFAGGLSIGIWYQDLEQVVPVELSSLDGRIVGSMVELKWITHSEKNNFGFEIERKSSTTEWGKIGIVKGNGTTTERHLYTFSDNKPLPEICYYRLKQLDYNGSFLYSSTITVHPKSIMYYELNQNYPNPFNSSTSIKYVVPTLSKVKMIIVNSLGESIDVLINEEQDEGQYEVQWNGDTQASGIYFCSFLATSHNTNKSFFTIKKMILLK